MAALRGPRRWAYQAFRHLPGPAHSVGEQLLRWRALAQVWRLPGFDPAAHRLLIGPLNTAGQAWCWAVAANGLEDTSARSVAVQRRVGGSDLGYPSSWQLSRAIQLRAMDAYRARVLGDGRRPGATHVLAESAWALLDDPFVRRITDDVPTLEQVGIRVAVVIHGSEGRDLRRHAELEPHSPFRGEWDERWHRLQQTVDRTVTLLARFDGPVFVPTPDMLDFVPGARLLPITVDVSAFATKAGALLNPVPIVLHAPTNPRLKGTTVVEEVATRLQAEGVITYRQLQGIPNNRMPAAIASADIVIDQIVLGNVATLAAESMAAGRLVIAHVAEHVRAKAPGLPVVEATPDTLEAVLRDIVANRTTYQQIAGQGPAWAREHHDGQAAAQVLGAWLGQ